MFILFYSLAIININRCGSFAMDAADIVDTTGAGDAFIGGFLFGLMQRVSLQVGVARRGRRQIRGAACITILLARQLLSLYFTISISISIR
jgi:sugar/nucleoside kinase (ribokinase family)